MRLFISQVAGRRVVGVNGERLGTLRDVVVGLEDPGYPPVRGMVVKAERRDIFVPIRDVVSIGDEELVVALTELPHDEFRRRNGEVLLENDIVDRQLIDVKGARVIRANDAELGERDGRLCLIAIDASAKGMLRRLVPRRLASGLEGEILDWAVIEPLASEVPDVRLQITHDKLAKLHPSDIARIIDSLAYHQSEEIMQALDDALAADTLEEVEEGRQVELLENLSTERAADILEEMAPDAAADVLDDLPPDQAAAIIEQMDRDESTDVSLLLTYPEDSVGGIMTTDRVVATPQDSVSQVLVALHQQPELAEVAQYVFIVEDREQERLLGVVALHQLLIGDGTAPMDSLMERSIHFVRPTDRALEAARVMTEYNLLGVPVVEGDGRLIGVVTADDALEFLLPDDLKRHTSRLFG
ncbi:MAG: CBS domain-containing protein [Chloroflexi bacterium]|nr:CBS domain-containing protein [Chloroflexota bacterium]